MAILNNMHRESIKSHEAGWIPFQKLIHVYFRILLLLILLLLLLLLFTIIIIHEVTGLINGILLSGRHRGMMENEHITIDNISYEKN